MRIVLALLLAILISCPAFADYFSGGGGGSGTVTSVGLTAPAEFTVSGSPVTSSGTLQLTYTGGLAANRFLSTPNGSTGAMSLRAIVDADLPVTLTNHTLATATTSGAFTVGGTVVPDSAGGRALGSASLPFSDLYIGGAATNNFRITGTATAARTVTLPNANSNTVIPDTGASNNFLTAISSGGVISKAQPAFSNISGTATIAQGGTNNGALGVSAVGIYNGDGSKVVQTTGTASQMFRVNSGATAIEAFTCGFADISGVATIAKGGTNNGSLGVAANGIIAADGSKLTQVTGSALQQFRVNAAGNGVEAFTPSAGGFSLTTTAKSSSFTNSDATGTFYPIDTTGGTVTVTLDNTQANGVIHVFQRTAGSNDVVFNRSASDVINYVGTTSTSKTCSDGSVIWLLKTATGWNVI